MEQAKIYHYVLSRMLLAL